MPWIELSIVDADGPHFAVETADGVVLVFGTCRSAVAHYIFRKPGGEFWRGAFPAENFSGKEVYPGGEHKNSTT